jgi:hypothetical protein
LNNNIAQFLVYKELEIKERVAKVIEKNSRHRMNSFKKVLHDQQQSTYFLGGISHEEIKIVQINGRKFQDGISHVSKHNSAKAVFEKN